MLRLDSSDLCRRSFIIGALLCAPLGAQLSAPISSPAAAQTQNPTAALGRATPRDTVLGFLTAARKGNMEVASRFLNTRLRGAAAERLAQQLSTVLDRRLPPRLQDLSDSPEGSPSDLRVDQDLVGTISSEQGLLFAWVCQPLISSRFC